MKFGRLGRKKAMLAAEFAPIVISLFYFIYPNQFLRFAETFLGKFVFLTTVVLYTYLDKIVGTFIALIFIIFYQSDLLENYEALNNYPEYISSVATAPRNISTSFGGSMKDFIKIESSQNFDFASLKAPQNLENFVGGLDDKAANFARQYCVNWRMVAEPGSFSLGYGPDGKCNPCDRGCWFYVLESKIDTEEKVLYPKSSAEWHDKVLGAAAASSSGSAIPPMSSPGVISEAFTAF
jgi:hypothetical protein